MNRPLFNRGQPPGTQPKGEPSSTLFGKMPTAVRLLCSRLPRRSSRLWLRIFLLTLLLLVVFQGAAFLLVYLEMESPEERRENMAAFIHDIILANMNGRTSADAKVYLDYFNGFGPQLWFEKPDGTVISGKAVPGLAFADRQRLKALVSTRPGVLIYETDGIAWETGPSEPLGILVAPVDFQDGPAELCYVYWNGRFPHMEDYFYHNVFLLGLAGCLSSLLGARLVSRPLRRLHSEMGAIQENNPVARVTEQGFDEVADVAKSVNQLTASLSRHLTGMRELLANASHELRSPLTRIGFALTFVEQGVREAERLRTKTGPDSPARQRKSAARVALALKHLGYMKEEVAVIEKLIGATLLTSRLSLQQHILERSPVNMSLLCAQTLAGNPGTEGRPPLSAALEDDLYVAGDSVLLRQVLTNLMDNAAKYTAQDGRVHVALLQEPPDNECRELASSGDYRQGTVFLLVDNTHPPFPERALQRFFEPFYRAAPATGDGSGLGLSLVWKIIRLHGGDVRAYNMPVRGENMLRLAICLPLLPMHTDAE